MLFLPNWSTFVNCPLAYAERKSSGWLLNLGVYDFAGSSLAHIAHGSSALVWAMMRGWRVDLNKELLHPEEGLKEVE